MANACDQPKLFNALKETLSKFQGSLHRPEDVSLGAVHPGNHVHTIFYTQSRRTSYYYHYPEVLPHVNSTDSPVYIYRAKSSPHGLLSTDICQKLPSVVCNEGYEARWTHNVGSNIVETGTLTLNDEIIQSFDSVSVDFHGQSMINPGSRDQRSINLGNIPSLQQWSGTLHEFETNFQLPWFYSADCTKYFPLYYCGMLDHLEHSLKLRRNLNDLLIVRHIASGKLVPADATSIDHYGGNRIKDHKLELPVPQMYGEYMYLSDIECEFNRAVCDKGDEIHNRRNVFYVEDVISMSSENAVELGTTVTFQIPNTEYPVVSFAWAAQNATAVANKYYSNYSTNAEDHSIGWSPIATSTINPGKAPIFKDMPSFRTERVYPMTQMACVPDEKGFNFWAMGVNQGDSNFEPGVVIKNGSVSVKLADMDPFLKLKEEGPAHATDKYFVHLRMTYIKRLTFTSFSIDERSRGTTRSEISITGSED